jgi:hypothetical protein
MRRELAAVMFRGCGAAGVLLGLWWGIENEPHLHCADNSGTASGLNRCTSHVTSGLVVHWGIALGGGVLIGATVGLVLAVLIRPRSRTAA